MTNDDDQGDASDRTETPSQRQMATEDTPLGAIARKEIDLLQSMARALEAAAAESRRIENEAELAAVQARNLAAFERFTTEGGIRAVAVTRETLARATSADRADQQRRDAPPSTTTSRSAQSDAKMNTQSDADVAALADALNAIRRATALEGLDEIAASFSGGAPGGSQRDAPPKSPDRRNDT